MPTALRIDTVLLPHETPQLDVSLRELDEAKAITRLKRDNRALDALRHALEIDEALTVRGERERTVSPQ